MLARKSFDILRNSMEDLTERSKVLKNHEVLVLSTGYEPMFKTGWKRALSAVLSGRAEVIENHETLWIGTSSGKVECPTVVRFITGIIAAMSPCDRTYAYEMPLSALTIPPTSTFPGA